MSKQNLPPNKDDEPHIESLVKFAGPRATLPNDARERLEARFRNEIAAAKRRRLFKVTTSLAVAASFLLVAVFLRPLFFKDVSPVFAAKIVRSSGTVTHLNDGTATEVALPGVAVLTGATLDTGANGRLLLALGKDQHSLRLDYDTRIKIRSKNKIDLLSGTLYMDTGIEKSENTVTIHTDFADISHIGTQFMVRQGKEGTRVLVREGSVRVSTPDENIVSEANHEQARQLLVTEVQLKHDADISRFGPHWDWTQDIAPAFDIHDKQLIEFLQWVSRETGRPLRFDSDASHQRAKTTYLRGSISSTNSLSPFKTLQKILPTTDFHLASESTEEILIAASTSSMPGR